MEYLGLDYFGIRLDDDSHNTLVYFGIDSRSRISDPVASFKSSGCLVTGCPLLRYTLGYSSIVLF